MMISRHPAALCPLYYSNTKEFIVIGNSNGSRLVDHINRHYNRDTSTQFCFNGAYLSKEKILSNDKVKPALHKVVTDALNTDCANLVVVSPWTIDVCEAAAEDRVGNIVNVIGQWYENLVLEAEKKDKVVFMVHQLIGISDVSQVNKQSYKNILLRNNTNISTINETLQAINTSVGWTRSHPRAIVHIYIKRDMDTQNGVHFSTESLDTIYHIVNNHTGYNIYPDY